MKKSVLSVGAIALTLVAVPGAAHACEVACPIAKNYYVIDDVYVMSDLSKRIAKLLKQQRRMMLGYVVPTRYRVAEETPTLELIAIEYGVTLVPKR